MLSFSSRVSCRINVNKLKEISAHIYKKLEEKKKKQNKNYFYNKIKLK